MIGLRRETFRFNNMELELALREEHDVPPNVFDKEDRVIKDFIDEIRSNDVFFDVGADAGVYSVIASKVSNCHVVAFEPNMDRTEYLRDNMKRYCNHRSMSTDIVDNGVEGVRLDEVAKEMHLYPDIIKIDVEGMEGLVLEGIEGISDRVRTLYIEVHHELTHSGRHGDVKGVEKYGHTPSDIYNTLKEYGYKIDHLVGRDEVHNIKAYK